MNGFAMIFGRCVWIPPSPKAALLVLNYFYGIVPGVSVAAYEDALRGQLVSAGATLQAAATEVEWLNGCFASYRVSKPEAQTR